MKYLVLVTLLFSALNSFGFASSSNDRPEQFLVLGSGWSNPGGMHPVNDNHEIFIFPCALVGDRVFCKERTIFRFENEQCAKTIFVSRIGDKMDITCNIKLRTILLGVTHRKALTNYPNTHYFYPVRLSKAVRLKPSRTPGFMYDIVVDHTATNSGW